MIDYKSPSIGERIPSCIPGPGRRFLSGVLRETPLAPTQGELEELVDLCFPPEHLGCLNPAMTDSLKHDLLQRFREAYSPSNPKWRTFSGRSCFLWRGSWPELVDRHGGSMDYHALVGGDLVDEVRAERPLPILWPAEKEALFTVPEIWTFLQVLHQRKGPRPSTTTALQNGTRHLVARDHPERKGHAFFRPDSYGFTRSTFQQLLSEIRTAQGKRDGDRLLGLDLGGSNGLAAYEAECIDPSLEFTSTTLDLEPAFWPLRGKHIFCIGEALPASFRSRFDLIFSLFTFRWMRFPHIALKNVLDSLAPGGVAIIELIVDKSLLGNKDSRDPTLAGIREVKRELREMEIERVQRFLPRMPRDISGMLGFQKAGQRIAP
jgi:hypothetical protein